MKYLAYLACERLDPVRVYGRPWCSLNHRERMAMMAYSDVREKLAKQTEASKQNGND